MLVGKDKNGNPVKLEAYRLAVSEADFWIKAAHPKKFAQEYGETFIEYLRRTMLQAAPVSSPRDLAWFLASYACTASARIEGKDIPAMKSVRSALEAALGLKFEGGKGEHFFRSTLVQTIFYGLFSAWVLWSKKRSYTAPDIFSWHDALWELKVPVMQSLFAQIVTPAHVGPLEFEDTLDWASSTLNRGSFFSAFEEGKAVQYFYEPFLEAFDPELRKQLGVWYTPHEIVQYMVARVDTVLREELNITDGLANPSVFVLDPCCGTGSYLVEVLKHIHQTLKAKGSDALLASDLKKAALQRVFGFEILAAPFVVSHMQLGLLLQSLGAPLSDTTYERAGVYLTNALTGWEPLDPEKEKAFQAMLTGFPQLLEEQADARRVKQQVPILVILGNPPYNAFAGTATTKEERDSVAPYKEGLIKKWNIKKFNLDDPYIRFFRMAEHLSKLPMSYYNRTPVGDTISRLTSDVETVSTIFGGGGSGPGAGGVSNIPTNLFKLTGVLIAMFVISPRLALIALMSAPVVYFVSAYFRKNTYRVQNQVRRTVSGINIYLQETFSGMRTIKAYGKENEYGDHFQKPLTDNLKAVNSAAVYDSYFPCVMQAIRAIVIAVVIWFGARTSVTETLAISIGSLAAMADLVTRFFAPIDAITGDFQTLQQALAGLKRIVELLREKPEEKLAAQSVPVRLSARPNGTAVEVKGLDFSYRKGEPVLGNVNLTVPQGLRVAIVGRTGAGKTTLLSLMAGLYKPDRATVSILGYDPHQVEANDRRRLLGIVPQNVHIFEGTIKENITLRDDLIPMHDIEKAASTVGLHDFITGLNNGYDALLGVEGTKLSRGQGQLLSLARAIVSDPPILLLDEPTSGVDAVTEASIIKAFRQASQNRTIVTISHRLSGILDAEEVHIMGSGRIVESGRPEELAGKEGWYSVYRQLENVGWKME